MEDEMGGKVIDAKHVAMYFKTSDENARQMRFGMNIVMSEKRTVLSQKEQNGA